MNWKTFLAMLARDARVARRNFVPVLLETFLQPLLFVLIFGRVMTGSGMMPPEYKSLLLQGIIAVIMILTGIQAVALPLVSEFQFPREIEDRLLAPMIFFGCVYYPWSALAPQFPHLSGRIVLAALLGFDALLLVAGLSRFRAKVVS